MGAACGRSGELVPTSRSRARSGGAAVTTATIEPLLDAKQLATLLGVRVQAMYEMSYRNEGPTPTKVGRRLRYAHADVQSWLKRQRAS